MKRSSWFLFLLLTLALLAGATACGGSSSSGGGGSRHPSIDDDASPDDDDNDDDDNDTTDDDDDDDNDTVDDDDNDDNDAVDDDNDDDDNDTTDDDDDDDNDTTDDDDNDTTDDDDDDDNDTVDDDDNDDNDDNDTTDDDAGESVWTDPNTGHVWQNGLKVGAKPFNEADAQDYCRLLSWAGYDSGWTLPDIGALRSLIVGCPATYPGGSCGVTDICFAPGCADALCNGCQANQGPGTSGEYWPAGVTGYNGWYFSSTSVSGGGAYAWLIDFDNAEIYGSDATVVHSVRCVINDCNASTCPNGCCDGTTCVPQTDNYACGANGAACVACVAATECVAVSGGGMCQCNASSCPNGCCAATGECVPQTNDAACGANGAACVSCVGMGAECVAVSGGGACQCDATSCPNGCCDGTTCWPGTRDDECGAHGAGCVGCDADQECVGVSGGGACVCDTNSCPGCCNASGACEDISVCWTDPTTGYTWQNEKSGSPLMLPSDAATYCAFLSLAGYTTGWQLPDIDQLRSLIRGCAGTVTGGSCGVTDSCLNSTCDNEASCNGCDYNGGPAPGGAYWPSEIEGPINWYWSSSPVVGASDYFYGVEFECGGVITLWDGMSTVARCVRP